MIGKSVTDNFKIMQSFTLTASDHIFNDTLHVC